MKKSVANNPAKSAGPSASKRPSGGARSNRQSPKGKYLLNDFRRFVKETGGVDLGPYLPRR